VALGVVCAATLVLLVSSSALANPSPGEPAEGLYVVDPAAGTPKLLIKGEEDQVTWSPDGGWLSVLDTNDFYFTILDPSGASSHRVDSFAWSNDGSKIAYTPDTPSRNGPIYVSTSTWSNPELVTRAPDSGPLAWAPDDRHFLYGTGGGSCCYQTLVVVTSNGSHPKTVLKTGGPYRTVWSPDGRLIAAVGDDQYIYLASVGRRARRLPGKWSGFVDPQWYPDGKSFVVYGAGGPSAAGFDAVQVSVPAGARKVVCRNCSEFGFSPDRRSIEYVNSKRTLWVENADGTARRRVAEVGSSFFGPGSVWSDDSTALLTVVPGSGDNTTLAIVDRATGKLTRLTDGTHLDTPIGISADGHLVAFERFAQKTGHELWLVASDGTSLRKIMSFGTCSEVAWSPKAALLAVTNLDDC